MILCFLLIIDYSILENICSFINEQLSNSKVIRVISSRNDGLKINEYREQLHYAMDRFKVRHLSS